MIISFPPTLGQTTPGPEYPGQFDSVENVWNEYTGETSVNEMSNSPVTAETMVVDEVWVDAETTDYEFQININGEPLFDSPQSPSESGGETISVSRSQGTYRGGGEKTVEVEITSAGEGGSSKFEVRSQIGPYW